MKNVEAIIFDADGTLFDSFEVIVAAYTHISTTHGLPIPAPDDVRSRLGSPLHDMFKAFYPDADIEKLLLTNHDYMSVNITKSKTFEGVQALLDDLTSKGIKLGILTSGTATIVATLEHHNLRHYFSSIVYTERIQKPKPDPEGFLLACHECEVQPEHALMVGDTVFDIETGKNAGALATIAITHGFGNPLDLDSSEPDYTVQNIAELRQLLSKV